MEPSSQHKRLGETSEHRPRPHDYGDGYVADANPLGSKDIPSPAAPKPWHWFGVCSFVLLSLVMLATILVVTAARDKKTSLLRSEEKRLQESVQGRIKILQTWLEAQHATSRRLTSSQVFRLFITDLARQTATSPLPRPLQEQRPYFRQLMVDFAQQNDMLRTTVMRADGTILLSSPGPALSMSSLVAQLEGADAEWSMLLSPIRHTGDADQTVVVDAMVPLRPVQAESEVAEKPSAVLVLTLPIGRILKEILSNNIAPLDHETISLFQQRGTTVDRLWITQEGFEFASDKLPTGIHPGMPAAFDRRHSKTAVYALGQAFEGVPWTLYQAVNARAVLAPVNDFIIVAASLSAMVVLALTSGFSALWWRRGRNHHRMLAGSYQAYARELKQQRQFLQCVMTSIGDWLTVSSPNGQIIYANPAFAAAVERPEASILGKVWQDLITEPAARKPLEDDLASLVDEGQPDIVEIGDERRLVSSRVSNLKAEDGSIEGTVRVVRDHTKFFVERRRRQQAITQTVEAFVHAIELRDPFLLGHTHRLRSHAIAIGRQLELSAEELASLALAASLSQIGKIFIPDDILTKPDRHGVHEGRIMRGHILHAVAILERVDFDLPIVDIVAQMHERLDGSGYPHGLVGGDICLAARVLGVADVFCARTATRSYRDCISAGKALYHLASNERRYDLKVVSALADIVGQNCDTSGLEVVEEAFIDADIWREKRHQIDRIRDSA